MRVAAIDCGTNSIRLLVAEVGAGRTLTDIDRQMRIVRLGQGVDRTGRLASEAIDRTREALADYVEVCQRNDVARVRMVATSATRDAENKQDFFAMTAELLGTLADGGVAEVITGEEEAHLSFLGAVADLEQIEWPVIVTDLGGGSTEIVLGDAGGVQAAFSADIGCVRLTERALPSDPPTDDEVAVARAIARDLLSGAFAAVPIDSACTWVGVAGTITTLGALAQGLTSYDPAFIHRSRVSLAELNSLCDWVIGMTRTERATLGPMHPGRVDVIGGGAIVCQELARAIGERTPVTELVVSEHDILDGIALSLI